MLGWGAESVGFYRFGLNPVPHNSPFCDLKSKTERKRERERERKGRKEKGNKEAEY